MREVFTEVYRQRAWGEGSGPGSSPSALKPYHDRLRELFHCLRVKSVLDLGCGYYGPHEAFYESARAPVDYTGVDCVLDLHDANQDRYIRMAARPTRVFLCFDFLKWAERGHLPKADLIILKDVLQHWPFEAVARLFKAFEAHQPARHVLIVNTTNGVSSNEDCPMGGFRPLDVTLWPIFLPAEPLFEYAVPDNPEPDVKRAVLWDCSKKTWRGMQQ